MNELSRSTLLGALLCACALAGPARGDLTGPLVLDTHVDIPDAYMRETRFDAGGNSVLQVDLAKMERGGLDAAFFVIYVGQGPLTAAGYAEAVAKADNKYSAIEMLVSRNPGRIALARTPNDVIANHAVGRLSAMIGIENAYSLGHDLTRLDAAYARGARYVGLVHVGNNDLCTSANPDKDLGETNAVGITAFGRAVVARAGELGMMVDISHASDACVRDVLAISQHPLIASHSSARALVGHARNLSDELVRAIASKDGVVQAVAYREFVKEDLGRAAAEKSLQEAVAKELGVDEFDSEAHEQAPSYVAGMERIQVQFPLATLEQYLDHVSYLVKVAGVDHVGIASDFDGGGGVTGWMDASQTRNVTAGLRRRGFSEGDIGKIWGGNLLRVWAAVETRAPASVPVAALDEVVDQVVRRYHLPGIAVGVIEDGRITYTGVRGEVRAGSGELITPKTLFKIASNSKAMTASVLARLVQAGKLQWNDPVVKYLPSFRMFDPWVTANMQVGDLLVHNSGLPEGGGDLMLWPEPNAFTRADIIAGLGHIKPAYGFRSGYAYDNLLYVVAGEVAAAAAGASYEDLVRREIFEPLRLQHCRVGEFVRAEAGSVAQPHSRRDGKNVVTAQDAPKVSSITSAAAGGIRCSLDDMLSWAINWLDPSSAQLGWLAEAQRKAMWQARTPMPISERKKRWDNTHFYAYAYGFRLADADGQWTVSHTGTLNGMYSVMMLLPDRKSGFVVLMNGEGDDARTVITEVLLKRFTAPEPGSTVARYADELARADAVASAPSQAREAPVSSRIAATPTSLVGQLGIYHDPWFGEASVCATKGGVEFASVKSPLLTGRLVQENGALVVDWDDDDAEARILFARNGEGSPTFSMSKVDPKADFSYDYEDLAFTRIRDCD